ncbi:hypothetical protein MMC31_002558, partial [Peltigera leucophlebia]|nr:hypothetical protein [Peltigera leucophlebia]
MAKPYESGSSPPKQPFNAQPAPNYTFTIAEVNTGKTWIFFIDKNDHYLTSFSGKAQGSYVTQQVLVGSTAIKVPSPGAGVTSPLASAVEEDGRTVHVYYLDSSTRNLSEVVFDGTKSPPDFTFGTIQSKEIKVDPISYLSAIGAPLLRVLYLND